MSVKSFRLIGVLSLALLGTCLAVRPAAAQQQGWPFNPEPRWWENGSSRSYRSYSPRYTQSTPAVAPAQGSAQIGVQVPAEAEVSFDGQPTAQTGASRSFVSSPLTLGIPYQYAVHVEWREGDRVIKRNRTITFKAGDNVNLDFTMMELAQSR